MTAKLHGSADSLTASGGPRARHGRGTPFRILLSSRDETTLQQLQSVINTYDMHYQIEPRLVGNGHVDPLHNVQQQPDLLALHLSDKWMGELSALCEHPAALRPPVLVISSSEDPEMMRLAMKAGARDFLTEPINPDELMEVLNRIALEKQSAIKRELGTMTAFINAKGGSGATLLACNTAHVMNRVTERDVILVDLDIQFGALAHYLDLQPQNGVMDALSVVEELDPTALNAYLVSHKGGLRVLGTTHHELLAAHELSAERVAALLQLLLQNCEDLVVDLPRTLDVITTTALSQADHIVVVVQQDFINVQDANRLIQILRNELGIPSDIITIAINRYDKHAQISEKDIRETLHCNQVVRIPNDYKRALQSLNNGIPLYTLTRSAPISKAICGLERSLRIDESNGQHGIFSKIFSRLTGN